MSHTLQTPDGTVLGWCKNDHGTGDAQILGDFYLFIFCKSHHSCESGAPFVDVYVCSVACAVKTAQKVFFF